MIYFMQAGDEGPIKIGKAKDVKKRLAGVQTGNPFKINLLLEINAGDAWMDGFIEDLLHKKWRDFRLEGEWFAPTTGLYDYISNLSMLKDDFNNLDWLDKEKAVKKVLKLFGITVLEEKKVCAHCGHTYLEEDVVRWQNHIKDMKFRITDQFYRNNNLRRFRQQIHKSKEDFMKECSEHWDYQYARVNPLIKDEKYGTTYIDPRLHLAVRLLEKQDIH